jgi:hypothetical protein
MTRHAGWLLMLASGSLALACSASGDSRGSSGGRGTGASGAGNIQVGTGGGTTISVIPQTGVDPSDQRELPIRKKVCDAAGNCSCLRLALLGTLDSAANSKDTTPFVNWLNQNSGGTAVVTMISSKPTLDATFLKDYDVLLIANVNSWSFSAAEKSAVEQWVRESGGGIVALTGFLSSDTEPAATSQLIDFTGIKYQPPKTAENGQQVPVYYKGGTTDLKNCLAWTGSSDAIITTPIHIIQQSGSMTKLTYGIDYVGAYIGWSVVAPPSATVVATDPVSGSNIAVAYELDGKGRIFAFGDEWVIFANQWTPQGNANNQQMDQYNPCWLPPTGGQPGTFHSVATLYQTKQFWYDAINWVAPPNECNFIVDDPDVVEPPR